MPGAIQSLSRAAAILRLLAGGERRLGLSEVAAGLGLAKGTAHGILRTLQQEGFVEQDPESGKYQLGAELLRLGQSYLDVHELRARALVWADDLARAAGETVYLGVLHQRGVLVVHHVFRPDDSRQVLEVGSMQPLHATALGKVLLAYDPVARGELGDGPWEAFTARTVTEPAALDAQCALVRERGWADAVEETWEGVASVAALVQDRRRNPVGAVCVSGAVETVCGPDGAVRPALVASVRTAARAISRDLGAHRF
ncbi:IclR family transcriptional regulator [Kitasatospora sp. NPDC057198]|uniref:IclR family transcriptional regulator n=1 Tax=Kitasatospora sp. NPDC057198 TaxID=3346046 RepID=UPI003636D41E